MPAPEAASWTWPVWARASPGAMGEYSSKCAIIRIFGQIESNKVFQGTKKLTKLSPQICVFLQIQ